MATYVLSDVHGHVRALDRALELASPGDGDEVYVLGDMIDRGPDPVGVIRLVRSLPGARALMGNHEKMMLDVLFDTGGFDDFVWALNGGYVTSMGFDALDASELADTIDWIHALPLYHLVETAGRMWILVHAGIDALDARGYLATAGIDCSDGAGAAAATAGQIRAMMDLQSEEDLLWTRERFWGNPTGLVGGTGAGPVVVAGHTPSIVLDRYGDVDPGAGVTEDGEGRIVRVGATELTGGAPDRIDIDCSAAAGPGRGRIGILRLDDGAEWYASIEEGE